MNRSRTMRRALLATTALVATFSSVPARSDTVISGGIGVEYVSPVTDSQLTLVDGFVSGSDGSVYFEATSLFDVRKGTLYINLAGTGALVKSTSDTVTLLGSNTYTGGTTINGGTLVVDGGATLGASGSNVSILSGGTLDLVGTTQTVGLLSLTGNAVVTGGVFFPDPHAVLSITGATVNAGVGETAAIDVDLVSAGTITKNGLGALRIGGCCNSGLTGPIDVNAGTLQLVWQNIPGASTINMNGASTLSLNNGVGNGQNFYNAVNLNAAGVKIDSSQNISVQRGVLSGSFGFEKTGAGVLGLTSTNTYTGLTTVSDGVLQLQDGDSGDYGSVAGDIFLNGGSLALVRTDSALNLAGAISGTGQVYTSGSFGSATLSGNNTFSGGVFLFSGTMRAGSSTAYGSGLIGGVSGTSFDLNGFDVSVGGLSGGQYDLDGRVLTLTGTTGFAVGSSFTPGSITIAGGGQQVFSGVDLSNVSTLTVNGTAVIMDSGNVAPSAIALGAGGAFEIDGLGSVSYVAPQISGSGSIALGDKLLETGGSNANTTLSGTISGFGGSLKKVGTGTLTLSGTNTFTGGIDLMQGGIRLLNNSAAGTGPITTYGSVISYANAVNSATPIIVNSNTTQLEVLAADVAQQSGPISEIGGPRPIEKIGTGTLLLSGLNSYTGATTITAGTLNVTGGSALSNSAAVNIGAAGTLGVLGSETIGSLSGSGILNLSVGSTLTTGTDNSSSLFSGTSSGLGDLTKSGTGTMTLTGTNSFAGVLAVAGGNLTVTPSGSLNGMSAFNVLGGASAFLGGSVQGVNGGGMTGAGLGSLSVSASGTLYLDDNTSLSGANLNLAPSSNLNLFLTTNTSQYPQISLSGAANIANANVGVYLDPITFSGTLATSFTYSNVITGSGVTGTFGAVNLLQSPSGLFSVAGIYTPTSAGIQVTRNAFSTLGGNGGNQDSVGDALEDIFINGPTDPDLLNLFTVIGSTPAGGVPAIYTAISGAENAENTGNSLRTDDPWKQSVAERVNAARTTGCTVAGETWCLRRYAQATTNGGEVMSDIQGDPTAFDWLETGIRDAGSFSVWGRIIGAWGESTGDVNGPGSTQMTGGFIGGADHVFNSLLLAGVAMQYVETDVDYDQSRNGSLIRSGQMGAYVSYGGAEAFVNGNISVIGSQASAKRFMSIGLIDYDVESLARSWTVTASVEGGTIMEIDGYRFEPSLAFNYQAAHPLDFEEKGGGGLSLIVRPDDSQSLRSILSARLSRVYDVGDRKLVPQLRIDWRHEMLDRRQEFSAAFAGDPTVFFDIDGAVYARDVFAAGASVTMPITGRITGYVDAQGAFSEDSTSAMVSVGGRATW